MLERPWGPGRWAWGRRARQHSAMAPSDPLHHVLVELAKATSVTEDSLVLLNHHSSPLDQGTLGLCSREEPDNTSRVSDLCSGVSGNESNYCSVQTSVLPVIGPRSSLSDVFSDLCVFQADKAGLRIFAYQAQCCSSGCGFQIMFSQVLMAPRHLSSACVRFTAFFLSFHNPSPASEMDVSTSQQWTELSLLWSCCYMHSRVQIGSTLNQTPLTLQQL